MKRRETLAWEKLRPLREGLGLSLEEVAAVVGRDKAWLSRLERGEMKRDLADWVVRGIAEKLETSRENLLESWPDVNDVQRAMGDAWRMLGDSALLAALGFEYVSDEDLDPVIEEFAASALRGKNNLIPQNYDDVRRRRKPREKKPEPHIFKVRISGDCMSNTVRDGEIVWFDTWLPREAPALVMAVRDEHEAHVKRLVRRGDELWLESDDGWSTQVDEHWRITAVAFSAQRIINFG